MHKYDIHGKNMVKNKVNGNKLKFEDYDKLKSIDYDTRAVTASLFKNRKRIPTYNIQTGEEVHRAQTPGFHVMSKNFDKVRSINMSHDITYAYLTSDYNKVMPEMYLNVMEERTKDIHVYKLISDATTSLFVSALTLVDGEWVPAASLTVLEKTVRGKKDIRSRETVMYVTSVEDMTHIFNTISAAYRVAVESDEWVPADEKHEKEMFDDTVAFGNSLIYADAYRVATGSAPLTFQVKDAQSISSQEMEPKFMPDAKDVIYMASNDIDMSDVVVESQGVEIFTNYDSSMSDEVMSLYGPILREISQANAEEEELSAYESIPVFKTVDDYMNNLETLMINNHTDLLNQKLGFSEELNGFWEDMTRNTAHLLNDTLPLSFFQTVKELKDGVRAVEFVGVAGTGKTTMAKIAAYALGLPCTVLTGHERLDAVSIFGGIQLVNGETRTVRSAVTKLIEEGGLLIFDEYTFTQPEAMAPFHSILDNSSQFTSTDGSTIYKVHPNFRVIFTTNPGDYAGVQEVNGAMQNRMTSQYIPRPSINVTAERLGRNTGYTERKHLQSLAKVEQDIHNLIKENSESGRMMSIRNLEHWIIKASVTGDWLTSSVTSVLIPLMRNNTLETQELDGLEVTFSTIKEIESGGFIQDVCRIIETQFTGETFTLHKFPGTRKEKAN